MYFVDLALSDDGTLTAKAKGHPTEVMDTFHAVCVMLLSSRGAWRITSVNGMAPRSIALDSDMLWYLVAKSKDRGA